MTGSDMHRPGRGAARPLAEYVESWTPGVVVDEDALPVGPVAALSAVLDLPEPVADIGDPLPPCGSGCT